MSEDRKVSQLPSKVNITGDEYIHVAHNGRSYKTTVNAIINKFNSGINLETLQEIQDKLDELAAIGNLVTAEEMAEAIAAIPEVDLSGYATTATVATAIAQAVAALPVIDLSSYATVEYVDGVVATAVDAIPEVDLSSYATVEYVDGVVATAVDAIPEVDLSGYAKVEDIPTIPDHSGFALKTELPDVSGFQTAEDVLTAITETAPDLSVFANKEEIPDVSGFMALSQVQEAIDTALEETDAFVRTSPNYIGRLLWVSGQVIETQDGTLAAPFATIQQAVDLAAVDNSPCTILCMPGNDPGYTNDVTISSNSNIIIQGWGAQGAHNVSINGTVTITGATTSRISFRDIAIRSVDDNPAIVLDGTQGQHYFMNVNVESLTDSTEPLVVFKNDEQHSTSFDGCAVAGRTVIENTVNSNLIVYFNGQYSTKCHLEINGDSSTYISNGCQFGSIDHSAGTVEVKYVGTWAGKNGIAINSTAVDKRCYAAFCDFSTAVGYLTLQGSNIVANNCIKLQ